MSSHTATGTTEIDPLVLNVTETTQRNFDTQNRNGSINGSVNGTATEKPNSPSNNKSSSEEDTSDFENVSFEDVIADCTFSKLIEKIRVFHYNVTVNEENPINTKCKLLFERDYKVLIVKNEKFTENYPKDIIVPVAKKTTKLTNPVSFDTEVYKNLVNSSLAARLRSRFVTPVILVDNKFICRAGTLTVWLSAMYETIKPAIPSIESITEAISSPLNTIKNALCKVVEIAVDSVDILKNLDRINWNVLEGYFRVDAEIMSHLRVERICDLMVERYKHYKDQVNLSSTEKNHEDLYKTIKMEELPFPGCEFFTAYTKANRQPEGLLFDWNQKDVTRTLKLTENLAQFFPEMDIENFKNWDLVNLTQNYLKIILSYIVSGTGGIVVHCISGWDRTPLFISLIRLSLWADGIVHQSLDYEDMAYLTLAYDWFLFGHNLPDRLLKKEEVMHFCFNFLRYVTSDDFSATRIFKELPEETKGNRNFPAFVPGRREVLHNIRNYVLDSYNTRIISRPDGE